MSFKIYQGDCREVMALLVDDRSVQCCVTSPPYFGLRDYGVDGQIGLEETPDEYVAKLVAVFREVRRVLRDDGTLWLNLGDSYAASGRGGGGGSFQHDDVGTKVSKANNRRAPVLGLKQKDLIGIPWRVAFALQADGWYLRQDIIWHKPNPMPESVRDRCTKAHEYIFLLAKSEKYYFDADAVAEPVTEATKKDRVDKGRFRPERGFPGSASAGCGRLGDKETRNRRSVWTVTTKPFKGAHFATFPQDLVEPCILAGSKPGGLVLDPFGGAGTTALVARKHGRRSVLIELNPEYVTLAQKRLAEAA